MNVRVTGFHLPEDLGHFPVKADEVMYYLYYPVSIPGLQSWLIPDQRLHFLEPLLHAVKENMYWSNNNSDDVWNDSYIYLTVKKMFVGSGVTANRPGWHCDGYLSDDLNYVWYDCVPTLFTNANYKNDISLSADHNKSLEEMREMAGYFHIHQLKYPNEHLLKLDDKVLHAVDTDVPSQIMRTFVKITVSSNRFNLKDNSKNPQLPDNGPFYERAMVRNDPYQAQRDHYEPQPSKREVDTACSLLNMPTPDEDHFK